MKNGIRLKAIKCFGESYVIGTKPPNQGAPRSCIDVEFKVSAPGGHPYEYGEITTMVSSTGCYGDTEPIGMPGFKPETLTVRVTKVTFCGE